MEAYGKDQNQCAITFGFGDRSWVFPKKQHGLSPKKQHGLSPLGHSLGRHEWSKAMPYHCQEALVVVLKCIPKVAPKIQYFFYFKKKTHQNY